MYFTGFWYLFSFGYCKGLYTTLFTPKWELKTEENFRKRRAFQNCLSQALITFSIGYFIHQFIYHCRIKVTLLTKTFAKEELSKTVFHRFLVPFLICYCRWPVYLSLCGIKVTPFNPFVHGPRNH